MKIASPIHHDRLPGHEVAVRRSKKYQRAHQILGRLQPLDRACFELELGQRLWRILSFVLEQARRDSIDANAIIADFARQRSVMPISIALEAT